MSAPVRVRFAPSPTGYLHVGGARTAIFNYLLARNTGGQFILRIEDTDQERSTRESEESLIRDLEWLGLDWDEGPHKGGPHPPYRQSERTPIYKEITDDFVARGLAYPCFATDSEIEAQHEQAKREKRPPMFKSPYRDATPEQVAQKRQQGMPESIRFRVGEGTVKFTDAVRGFMELDHNMVSDFVILRSNGLPTYNFAAAVDDWKMEITHVLRGEEHLSNTLRQAMVYDALGAELPIFAHLPLILAEDRSKLSKRHGASSVDDLRSRGYLASAVVNYLVLLGWSHPDSQEIMPIEEMIRTFGVDRINKAGAVFDLKKLSWMNGQHIRAINPDEFVAIALPYLPDGIKQHYDAEQLARMCRLLQDSVEFLDDLKRTSQAFAHPIIVDDEATEFLSRESSQAVVAGLSDAVTGASEWTADFFKGAIKTVGKEAGVKGKDLFFPVRAALTGSVHGPDLVEVAVIKGKERVAELLGAARSA